MNEPYDVAVSFLRQDESLALEIHSNLTEHLKVFVYSKNQEELAGTDGLESFREVFRQSSRLVVVLYREGWGQTRWTRIEEAAIKDRCFAEGWEWLLFVMLTDADTPPKWLPETEIRLSYSKYGLPQLLGAIKRRAQELGAKLRTEAALDRAVHLEEASRARADRDRLLSETGVASAQAEFKELVGCANSKIEQLASVLSTWSIEANFDGHDYTLRTGHVSINFFLHPAFPATNFRIVLGEFIGALSFSHEQKMYSRTPVRLSKTEYYFDYQAAYGWCWRLPARGDQFLTSDQLGEQIIKRLLDLHERFEKGEIKWEDDW